MKKLDVLTRLQELVAEVEAEESANSYGVGDLVSLNGSDEIGTVEAYDDETITVRIQEMNGEQLEPTDDVRVLAYDAVQAYNMTDEPKEEEVEEEEDDDEEEEDEEVEEDEDGEKTWVTFVSADGVTTGRIVEEHEESYIAEVYVPTEEGFDATGIEVEHLKKDCTLINEPHIKQHKSGILAKFTEMKMGMDEEAKIGIIDGYASTFGNVDLGGDRVMKGAYNKTFNDKKTRKVFFDHIYGMGELAGIGYFDVDEKGLRMKAELPLEATDVKNNFVKIKFMLERGEDMGLSIGYNTVKSRMNQDGVRDLLELAVMETSITPFPMNTEAQILSAKARKISYQAKRATWQTIVPQKEQPDAHDSNQLSQADIQSLVDDIKHVISTIKKKP